MEWVDIITNIITLLTGGGLSWLFFWKLNKKEKKVEVDSKAITNMEQVLEEVKSRNESLHDRLSKVQDELNASEDESIQLKSKVAILRLGFCSHQICPLRNPAYGNKIELSADLFDTKEIQTVANEKGYVLQRYPLVDSTSQTSNSGTL